MSARPIKCCGMGTYDCQVPMPLGGRLQGIDYCIADLVAALNAANISTVASCCGHDKVEANIMLEYGRVLIIKNPTRPWEAQEMSDPMILDSTEAKVPQPPGEKMK